MKKGKIMRKLILIALIFSLQILQGQVTIEKVWSKYCSKSTILSYSNSLDDNSLLISHTNICCSPGPTFLFKLDAYDTNKTDNFNSHYYNKAFFNYENKPYLALSYPLKSACYLDSKDSYDSLYCLEINDALYGSISYKNNIIILNNSLSYKDSILHFSTHSISDIQEVKKYSFKMPRSSFGNLRIEYSSKNEYFVVSSFTTQKTIIDIFTKEGNLVSTIDDLYYSYTGSPSDLNNLFHFFENENYLLYFGKNGLIKYNLQTFEKKEVIAKPFYGNWFSAISPNEKFMLVSSNDSLNYIDLTTMEMTLLSEDKFKSLTISNSNEYFYGIKLNESEFLYKYRIKTPTSINEEENKTNLSISPNPTSDFINIAGVEPETSLELTNILGETVWSGIGVKQISTQALPNGTYFLKTTKGSQIKSQKVLVWR